MRFLSISINLLELFRIMSFVFDLKYLSQNSINFNILGVFWNPQNKQISKLSLNLYLEQRLKEILRFFAAAGAVCHHWHCIKDRVKSKKVKYVYIYIQIVSKLLIRYCVVIGDGGGVQLTAIVQNRNHSVKACYQSLNNYNKWINNYNNLSKLPPLHLNSLLCS